VGQGQLVYYQVKDKGRGRGISQDLVLGHMAGMDSGKEVPLILRGQSCYIHAMWGTDI